MSDTPAHLVPADGVWMVYFADQTARLNSETKETLDVLADVIRRGFEIQVDIVGHASAAEPLERQRPLSEERAEATKAYLVTRWGIDPARITSHGRGADGAPDGSELDRRVVVILSDPFVAGR